jgi:hypothetical protein
MAGVSTFSGSVAPFPLFIDLQGYNRGFIEMPWQFIKNVTKFGQLLLTGPHITWHFSLIKSVIGEIFDIAFDNRFNFCYRDSHTFLQVLISYNTCRRSWVDVIHLAVQMFTATVTTRGNKTCFCYEVTVFHRIGWHSFSENIRGPHKTHRLPAGSEPMICSNNSEHIRVVLCVHFMACSMLSWR